MLPALVRRFLLPVTLLLVGLVLSGCSGMYHANATVGPDMQPHLTTGISIPFGK